MRKLICVKISDMKTASVHCKKSVRAILLIMLLSTIGMTYAHPVGIQNAREVGVKFLNANTRMNMTRGEDLSLATTYNTPEGTAAFYVFNTTEGFVIVSADDCVTPILGYSGEGRPFDPNNVPIQMQEYLQGFVEQIQYGIENHLEANEAIAQRWARVMQDGRLNDNRSTTSVEPLLTTTWNQGCYYNALCPEDPDGSCGHVVTGCTATAMAQVMRYWSYPENGIGYHSYTPNGYPEQSVDFGATTYDWENMPNILNGSSSAEQIEAVATLMWHCGVSVDMSYGVGGSGGFLYPSSLINYFGYSDEISLEYRSWYSEATWKAKLKDCLNLNRPVFYVGYGIIGGHAFVCDGYDHYDMFHFNWGWDGYNDGYFFIDALLNDFFGGFNDNNIALFNIHPQAETTNYVINVSANNEAGGTVSGGGNFPHGSSVTLSATANNGYYFCYWEENGGIASTNPNYSFTANFNRNLVAVFAEPFTVTVTATEGGTASGSGSFPYGQSCTVTATADEGYSFANWTRNGEVVSFDTNYTFPVTGESLMTAHFVTEENIVFADANVKAICVANWDTNGDGELSYAEAASVTSLGFVFSHHTEIISFTELQYFISLTSINNSAFSGCTGLSTIEFPYSVTTIGDYAFYGCSGFWGSFAIPNTVREIKKQAFEACTGFISLIVLSETPARVESSSFDNISTTIPVYVPCESVQAYQQAYGWNAFSNIIGICSSGTVCVLADPLDGGGVSGGGTYEGGSLCNVVATPNEGYCFANWTKNSDVVSLNANYTFIVTDDALLIAHFVPEGNIDFADANVKAICVANWDTNGDGELSYAEAASVKSLGEVFRGNTEITSFEELQFFISLPSINNYAFNNCSGLTGSLILPNYIKSIGEFAFEGCSGFTGNLTIPNSVTSIGSSAFRNCNGLTGELTIPNSITVINASTFEGCSGFTGDLTIPNSVTSIGSYAFRNCNGFTGELTIPNSITIINRSTFEGCSGFTGNLTIPNSVTEIGYMAFNGCSGFTGDFVIPNSVTEIEGAAFSGCSGFTGSLTIGSSVTTIGINAFYNCSGFTGNLTIPNSVTSIDSYAFRNCNGLTGSLTIGNSVTYIGFGAFEDCQGLTGELFIPNSVTLIETYAFHYCKGLISLILPNTAPSIGDHAFIGCSGLKSMIALSEFPPSLGPNAFSGVSTDIPVYVPFESVNAYQQAYGWDAFSNIIGICLSGTVCVLADPPEGGEVSGGGTYEGGSLCNVVATPNEGYCFANWTKNSDVVSLNANYTFIVTDDALLIAHFVPEGNIDFADANVKAICVANWDTNGDGELSYTEAASVRSLGGAFNGNTEITSFEELQFFISLSSINNYAFMDCSGLTGSLILPNSVRSIGYMAFYGCSGFTGSLTIPNSVTEIGGAAFSGCSGFTGSLTIPNSVTEIGGAAFSGCSGFTGSLTIGNSVTEIGGSTFNGCSGFTGSLNIPNSVITIGDWAFLGCSGFTGNLVIPNSVTTIGNDAFRNCRGLTGSLTLGNSMTSIGSNAFWYCQGLTSLILPNTVPSIGDYAFACCYGLKSMIALSELPPPLGQGAFSGVSTNIPVYVPFESVEAYQQAYGWDAFSNIIGICSSGTVCVLADPPEGGEVSGGGTYEGCSLCNVVATPNEGYCFVNWTKNNDVISLDANYTFMVTDDALLIAHFVPEGNVDFADANVKAICVANWDTNGDGELSYTEAASVRSLGGAFNGNTEITSFEELQFFISLSSINNYAFMDCSGLTGSLILPNSVRSIGYMAFYGCSGFTGSLTIPNSVTEIGGAAFSGCSGFTGSLTIPNSVTEIGGAAFSGCSGFTGSLIIGNSVTEIGTSTFDGCSGFTGSLIIGNSVTTIGNYAFYECSGFTGSLTLGNSVTSIGYAAFCYCHGLTGELFIPNTVTSIGSLAFWHCQGLTSLILPNTVPSIGDNAFAGCYGLMSMSVLSELPPSLGTDAFSGVSTGIPVYVPCESVEAYQNAAGWSGFTNFIGMCSGNITVAAYPVEGGSVMGGGSYEGGEICTLTAIANEGYSFLYWTEGGIQVSSNSNYSFIVTSDRNLVANFMEGDVCAINFDFYDSFGDGWSGNMLLVTDDSGSSYEFTLEGGSSGTQTLILVSGSHITLTWIEGNWMGECSFTVSYADGTVIYEGSGLSSSFFYEFDVNCSSSVTAQTSDLAQGWNWWSTYVEQEGIDGLTMLEESLGENGYQIKSQTDFVTNYGSMWFGMLGGITNEETYMIDNTTDCQIEMTGAPVSPADHPITINNGWNWIGYPSTHTMGVAEALADFLPANGDQIKSQSNYSVYYNGMWMGQLQSITPGTGLMYKSNNTESTILVYPDGGRNTEAATSAKATHWTNDIHAYPHNMTVMAVVELDEVELTTDNYELAVFANGECRGSVKLMNVEPLNRHMAFLTVSGKDAAELTFRLYDTENGMEYYDAEESLSFTVNATVSEPEDVFVVHFRGTTGMDELASSVQVYPNPVNGGEQFSIGVNAESKAPVRVEIVNALGVETLRATSAQMPAMLTAPSVAGVYTLRITVEGKGTVVRKLLVK